MHSIQRVTSFVLALVLFVSTLPLQAAAIEEKFVALNVCQIDNKGTKKTTAEPVYIKNNEIFVSADMICKYTLYNFDEEHCAFVRNKQTFRYATSKIVINPDDASAEVYLLQEDSSSYDLGAVLQMGGQFFFPLGKIAACLKAEICYNQDNSITITNSGYSLCDAMYRFNSFDYGLNYQKIIDDIYFGEAAYWYHCVVGFFGSTVFDRKISNLAVVNGYGDFENYKEIIESAVTDTEAYYKLCDTDGFIAKFAGKSDKFYDSYEDFDKGTSAVSKTLIDFSEASKQSNQQMDKLLQKVPYGQAATNHISKLCDVVSKIEIYLDFANYFLQYFAMNEDHSIALKIAADIGVQGNEKSSFNKPRAFQEIAALYSQDFKTSLALKISDRYAEEMAKIAKKSIDPVNKAAIAIDLTAVVFKYSGFDLTENDGYNIMLAAELISYVRNHAESQLEKLLDTAEDSENLRLSMIMTLLLQRESYKMGNKASARTDGSKTLYNQQIKEVNARLALFYRAIESKGYDDFANLSRLMNTNSEQLGLLKLDSLQETTIDKSEAVWSKVTKNQIHNFLYGEQEFRKMGHKIVFTERETNPSRILFLDTNDGQIKTLIASLDNLAKKYKADNITVDLYTEGIIVKLEEKKSHNTLACYYISEDGESKRLTPFEGRQTYIPWILSNNIIYYDYKNMQYCNYNLQTNTVEISKQTFEIGLRLYAFMHNDIPYYLFAGTQEDYSLSKGSFYDAQMLRGNIKDFYVCDNYLYYINSRDQSLSCVNLDTADIELEKNPDILFYLDKSQKLSHIYFTFDQYIYLGSIDPDLKTINILKYKLDGTFIKTIFSGKCSI